MYTTKLELEEFISEYKRSRVIIETTVRAVLNRALEFEVKFDKYFYNFNTKEALELFKDFHAISPISLQNSNLILKHAARWMIDKKQLEYQSVYEEIVKSQLETCIDTSKRSSLILTRNELTKLQDQLLNYTDKAILELLFLGAGGNWLKELTFFNMNQIKDNIIYFDNKQIPIDDQAYSIIKQGCEEEELISFGSTVKSSEVKSYGIYKQRFNALSSNNDYNNKKDLERRFRFVQRRLALIKNDIGVNLTSGNVQNSGLLHLIKKGIQNNNMTFREYIKTNECRQLAKRYDIYTDFYSQVLCEKFENYVK